MAQQFTDFHMLRLVETCQIHPCLWYTKSELYKNQNARNSAYKDIWEKLNIPGLTIKDIPKKIKDLRTSYYQELKRIENSARSGDQELYKPKVSWFDKADGFLRLCKIKQEKIADVNDEYLTNQSPSSSLEPKRKKKEPSPERELYDISQEKNVVCGQENKVDCGQEKKEDGCQENKVDCGQENKEDCGQENKVDCGQEKKEDCGKEKKKDCCQEKKEDCCQEKKVVCGKENKEDCCQEKKEDCCQEKKGVCGQEKKVDCGQENKLTEFEITGMNIARKLQRMDEKQAIFAEYIINSVIRKGLLKELTEGTGLCENLCENRINAVTQPQSSSKS